MVGSQAGWPVHVYTVHCVVSLLGGDLPADAQGIFCAEETSGVESADRIDGAALHSSSLREKGKVLPLLWVSNPCRSSGQQTAVMVAAKTGVPLLRRVAQGSVGRSRCSAKGAECKGVCGGTTVSKGHRVGNLHPCRCQADVSPRLAALGQKKP